MCDEGVDIVVVHWYNIVIKMKRGYNYGIIVS